jgi:uncharacterized protein (DUF427 family)
VQDYPQSIPEVDRREPVPRRIRAMLGGRTVIDTTRAIYLWEWPHYPQYYIPLEDIDAAALVDEGRSQHLSRGTVSLHGLRVGELERPHCVRAFTESSLEGLRDRARVDWDALDAWFEEDEEVFVHPRDPYTRVDALRSARHVRVELGGQLLAESGSPVMVFETGLPTRYYLNRTEVELSRLVASPTVTACPYKGRTTGYWSVRDGDELHADLAWCYDFPTRQLLPIAGLIAFYNEKVDILLDGVALERPQTHFS